MLNRIKGIKASLDHSTLNELSQMMDEFEKDLAALDVSKYEKLYNIICENDIFNMKYDNLPKYLDKLSI